MPTESSEDYLEAILYIRSERGSYRNVDRACLLMRAVPLRIKSLESQEKPPPWS